MRSDRASKRRLTRDQVASIAAAHAAGGNARELAAAYGVTKGTIHAAVREVSGNKLRPEVRPYAVRGRPPQFTTADLEDLFVAVVNAGGLKHASQILGLPSSTIGSRLRRLYTEIGASTDAHAVWLLWPRLGDRFVLPIRGGS